MGGIKQELKETSSKLAVSETHLQQSKEALKVAETELSAAEAVVTEQTCAESSLTAQGSRLQKEVEYQRNDRNLLLEKVASLKEAEVKRTKDTSVFVGTIVTGSDGLCEQIAGMLSKSHEDSKMLCGGVDDMLSRGRDTCITLQDSIDQALKALVGNAETAKDDMIKDCADLKNHLKSTDTALEDTLQGLRRQLSDWLGEVDEAMTASLQQNELQKVAAVQLAQDVRTRSDALIASATAFQADQSAKSEQVAKTVDALQSSVLQGLEAYATQAQQDARTADEAMAAQAAAMQEQVSSMLQALLATSTANRTRTEESAKAHVQSTTDLVCINTAAVKEANGAMTDGAANHVAALTSACCGDLAATKEALEGEKGSIAAYREASGALVATVSSDVAGKRAHMNDTVTTVVKEAGESIESASSRADSAATAAAKVLTDVRSASQSMTASSSDALTAFTTYMDGQGTEVCADVKTHFSDVRIFLGSQAEGVQTLSQSSSAFRTKMEQSGSTTTGSTPIKIEQRTYDRNGDILAALSATRAHDIIKEEARAGQWEQPDTRPVAMGALESPQGPVPPSPRESAALELSASTSTSSPISARREGTGSEKEENEEDAAELITPPPAPTSTSSKASSVSSTSTTIRDENACPNPPPASGSSTSIGSRSRASSKLGTIPKPSGLTKTASTKRPVR